MNTSTCGEKSRPLVDISQVSVNKELPKEERVLDFARQLGGNPYCFTCNGFTINASYADVDVSIEDRLRGIVR